MIGFGEITAAPGGANRLGPKARHRIFVYHEQHRTPVLGPLKVASTFAAKNGLRWDVIDVPNFSAVDCDDSQLRGFGLIGMV